jgi:hypothetical protein
LSTIRYNGARETHVNIYCKASGLRGLEVTFPPLDPSDAGSNPAEVVDGKIEGTESSGRDFKPFDPCSRFTAR